MVLVEVMNPKIEIRHIDDDGERFKPAVTSPFYLTMNEKQSHIIIHAGDNYGQYLKYLHYPTKPIAGCLTLAEIRRNGEKIKGDFIDIMVIVKFVQPTRKITLKKDGTEKNIRDVIVIDQSETEMNITFWDVDYIKRSVNLNRME